MLDASDGLAYVGLDRVMELLEGPDVLTSDLVVLCVIAKRSTFREGSHLMKALLIMADKLTRVPLSPNDSRGAQ